MSVFSNVIKPQGLEPLQFPTKFRSHSSLGIVLRFELYCFPSACQNERFNHGLLGLKPVDDAVDNDG